MPMSDDCFGGGLDADGADPVVIVGMGVEAPGGIETAQDYWDLLARGREALGPFPDRPRLGGARTARRLAPQRLQRDPRSRWFPHRGNHFRSRVLRHLTPRGRRDGSAAAGGATGGLARMRKQRHQSRRPRRARCGLLRRRLGHRLRTRDGQVLRTQRSSAGRHRAQCDLGPHRLHAGIDRAGTDIGLLVRIRAGGLSRRDALPAERRLRSGDRGRGQRAGFTGLLRRVLQTTRTVRRRILPPLQRTGQRNRVGRGSGDVCAAT